MTRRYVMEFERPLVELEAKLEELQRLDLTANPELVAEVATVAEEIEALRESTYADLSAWDRVQISRHPDRPKAQDYLAAVFTDVVELHGDRAYGDDEAIVAALATVDGHRVAVLGHRKGKNTRENIARNFGMPHPEGFRKAMRIMRLANKFGLPLVTLIDTPGAFPGIEAEERGQAWAIAESLALLSGLRVPVVAVGIGEGGSGGALAIGFGDRLIMLENAYYSVISPEACASILHKDAGKASEVATCLAMTAADLAGLGIVDEIISEPSGGAHRQPEEVFGAVRERVSSALTALAGADPNELVRSRYERLRSIGVIEEGSG
ncbi:MAG: acetyl-CoA carboxylase carboxyltransferase subunit alpha [Coriobacteriia bacterium]|nr:acetyl-CoA carboxylase carboxyltransferase subunit alpha [Coriobacteriia bacterium]